MCRHEDRLAMSRSATQIGLAFSTPAPDAGSVQRRGRRSRTQPGMTNAIPAGRAARQPRDTSVIVTHPLSAALLALAVAAVLGPLIWRWAQARRAA